MKFIGYKNRTRFRRDYIKPLVECGKIKIKDNVKSNEINQLMEKYGSGKTEVENSFIEEFGAYEIKPIAVDNNTLNSLNVTLPIYKHTFKQAENGNYYWVSTELTNY